MIGVDGFGGQLKIPRNKYGAQRLIANYPDKIFLDPNCKNKLPIPLKITNKTKFHLVVVAHGASRTCAKIHGGTGSLMFNNEIKGINGHSIYNW